jgi:hypothetical protein
MSLDSSYFLAQVKLKGSIPTGRFTDSEILDVAHDVMLTQVVPFIISMREEYYVAHENHTITASVTSYPISYRAMGLSLREVKLVRNGSIIDLPRMSPEEVTSESTGTPRAFYLEAGNVILYPTPSSTEGTLKLSYFKTPNKIVEVADTAVITAIDTVTGVVTAGCPTTWTTADEFDLISRHNGHRCLALDLTASAVSTTSATFAAADLPSTLAVGDYIALAGQSPYLEVPDVAFDWVVRLTVNVLLESMSDQAGLQAGMAHADIIRGSLASLLTNRVVGAPKRSRIHTL